MPCWCMAAGWGAGGGPEADIPWALFSLICTFMFGLAFLGSAGFRRFPSARGIPWYLAFAYISQFRRHGRWGGRRTPFRLFHFSAQISPVTLIRLFLSTSSFRQPPCAPIRLPPPSIMPDSDDMKGWGTAAWYAKTAIHLQPELRTSVPM